MGETNYWTTDFPFAALVLFVVICWLGYGWSEPLDGWFTSKRKHRIGLVAGKFIAGSAAAILACFPSWQSFSVFGASVIDSAVATAMFAATSITVLVECIQLRQTDTVDADRERIEKERDKAETDKKRALADEFFYRWVSVCFLKAVGEKADRFQKAAHGEKVIRLDHSHTVAELRRVADPNQQIVSLIQIVYSIYQQLLMQANDKAKLRVAYLRAEGQGLRVRYAWDGANQNCIKSLPKKAKDRFKLTGEPRCSATWSVRSGRVEIIPDTQKASESHECGFEFCYNAQRTHLRSLLVIPIREHNGKDSHGHVICVDTDEVNFFSEDQREKHEYVQKQLEMRLLVELGIERILMQKAE